MGGLTNKNTTNQYKKGNQKQGLLATIVLVNPNTKAEVHLLGICHTSSFSGFRAYETVKQINPEIVLVEVDEERLDESARRARLWLGEQNTEKLVRGVTDSLTTHLDALEFYRTGQLDKILFSLRNEGAAAVEGGVYGNEIVLACRAALEIGAEIVLGDRNKRIGDERLRSKLRELQQSEQENLTYLQILQQVPYAVLMGINNWNSIVWDCWRCVTTSQYEWFGHHLHPVFYLPQGIHQTAGLKAAGCNDVQEVSNAVQSILQSGTQPNGSISPQDLEKVQNCVMRVEYFKHQGRQRYYQKLADGRIAEGANVDDRYFEMALYDKSQFLELGYKNLFGVVGSSRMMNREFWRWQWRGLGSLNTSFREFFGPQNGSDNRVLQSQRQYYETVIGERDAIMLHNLWEASERKGVQKVVGVVGANHLPGIVRGWKGAGLDDSTTRQQLYQSNNITQDSSNLYAQTVEQKIDQKLVYAAEIGLLGVGLCGWRFGIKGINRQLGKLCGIPQQILNWGAPIGGIGAAIVLPGIVEAKRSIDAARLVENIARENDSQMRVDF